MQDEKKEEMDFAELIAGYDAKKGRSFSSIGNFVWRRKKIACKEMKKRTSLQQERRESEGEKEAARA